MTNQGLISKWGLFVIIIFWVNLFVSAQTIVKKNSTFSAGGSSTHINLQHHSFIMQQSIGQGSVIGTTHQAGYVLRQGFIQPHGPIVKVEEESTLSATIFPNPFSEELTIELKENQNEPVYIILSDILGKIVFKQTASDSSLIFLNPGPIPSGVYMLRMNTSRKQHISKLIKD